MATGTGNPGNTPNRTENTGPKTERPAQNAGGEGTMRPSPNLSNQTNQPNRPMGSTQPQAEPPEAVASAIDDVSDKAKEVVDRASEGLKQTSANAALQVQQAQKAMFERANEVKATAASQLFQAAASLRSEVRTEQGQPVQQAEALAANLEQLGRYLEAHSFDEIESDVRHTIQRNPWQSVGIAVAVGWIMSRIFGPRRKR